MQTRPPTSKLTATHPTCGKVEGVVLSEMEAFYVIELTKECKDAIRTYRIGMRIIVPKKEAKSIKVTPIV